MMNARFISIKESIELDQKNIKNYLVSIKIPKFFNPVIKIWFRNYIFDGDISKPYCIYSSHGWNEVQYSGVYWLLNNQIHCDFGPAIVDEFFTQGFNSEQVKLYYLNGDYLSQEEWFRTIDLKQQYEAIWNL